MTTPDLAVIIPCYNAAPYLDASVGSVVTQDDVALRVIIIDDGSTDDSAAIARDLAERHPCVQLLQQRNGGVASARNAGLAEVGDAVSYVMFLDADDVLRPGALRQLATALEQRTDASAVAGTCERIDETGRLVAPAPVRFAAFQVRGRRVLAAQPCTELPYSALLPANAITTPGQCLVRRRALGATPFDGRFTPCEDWDLWLRLSATSPIITIDHAVLQYRHHAAGISKRYDTMRRHRLDVLAAQRASADDDATRALVDVAYWFVRFAYDRRLNASWAYVALRRREPRDAVTFAARVIRLTASEWAERMRNRRVPWWERLGAIDPEAL